MTRVELAGLRTYPGRLAELLPAALGADEGRGPMVDEPFEWWS